LAFTGRKKTKTAGHPAGESMRLKAFLKKYDIKTIENFTATLINLSRAQRGNQKPTVPTWNTNHDPDQPLRKRKPDVRVVDPELLAAEKVQVLTPQAACNLDRKALLLEYKTLHDLYEKVVRQRNLVEARVCHLEHRNRAYEGFFQVEDMVVGTKHLDELAERMTKRRLEKRAGNHDMFPKNAEAVREEYKPYPPPQGGFLHEMLEITAPQHLEFKTVTK